MLKEVKAVTDAIPEVPPLSQWYEQLARASQKNSDPLPPLVIPEDAVLIEFLAKMDTRSAQTTL
jgi:hypothetical protein